MEAGAGSTRVLRPMLLYLYPMECGFGVCRIWRGWGKKDIGSLWGFYR